MILSGCPPPWLIAYKCAIYNKFTPNPHSSECSNPKLKTKTKTVVGKWYWNFLAHPWKFTHFSFTHRKAVSLCFFQRSVQKLVLTRKLLKGDNYSMLFGSTPKNWSHLVAAAERQCCLDKPWVKPVSILICSASQSLITFISITYHFQSPFDRRRYQRFSTGFFRMQRWCFRFWAK